MNLRISFKHLEHTPALDERIREKSGRFDKFLHGQFNVGWTCWVEGNEHWAEVKIHGDRHNFFAKACSENMYKSLDKVVHKIEKQLERLKDQQNKMHSIKNTYIDEIEEIVEAG